MTLTTDIAFGSLSQLGKMIRSRQITSLELVDFFLKRCETIGPELNAIVTLPKQHARQLARKADKELASGTDRGPLHGIPYGVKDLLSTKGIPTSWGAAPLKDQMLDMDATVIQKLTDAGAILIAKLAMVEIAGGLGYRQANASFTGPGLNPWKKDRWSGGSSSGCGSAVAAGLVPFAIGSETWGSIVTPAGYCGLSGIRPTYGRVSRYGAMALSWTMDKLGPMCHSASDCGIVLNVVSGQDPLDPSSSAVPFEYPGHPRVSTPFRIATLKNAANKLQDEVRKNYCSSLKVLKTFCKIEEIELPPFPYGIVAGTIITCEMAAAFETLVHSGDIWEMTAEEDQWGIFSSLLIPATDYINALRIRSKIQLAMEEVFQQYDAIVVPNLTTVAPPIDDRFSSYVRGFTNTSIGAAANVAGLPGIAIPNGFGEDHLPTSLQFVSRAWEENLLLKIAETYQQKTDWHKKHPEK